MVYPAAKIESEFTFIKPPPLGMLISTVLVINSDTRISFNIIP